MTTSSYELIFPSDYFGTEAERTFSDSDIRDYSEPRLRSRDYEMESKFQRNKKTNTKYKTAYNAKYSVGQLVYVKKYNARSGNFQICDGEIISSIDKGFGAISYTWLALNTGKTYRAWEDEIYPSYSSARASLDIEESQKEVKKEEPQCYNLQNNESAHCNLKAVSGSLDTGMIMLKNSSGVEREAKCVVDDIDEAKSDIIAANSRCSDIELRVNYLDKELSKEKKKRSKLVKLGIACLFGG